jgi:hypothetical protein
VLVSHDSYPIFSTQLYFQGDPARAHDWREATFAKDDTNSLKATEPALTLNLQPCSRRLTSSRALAGAAEAAMWCVKEFDLVLPTEAEGQPSKKELSLLRAVVQNFEDPNTLLYEELLAEVTANGKEKGMKLVADTNSRIQKAKAGKYESRFALKSLKSNEERINDANKKRITAVVCRQPAAPIALCKPWIYAATKPWALWAIFLYFFVALPVALVSFLSVWFLRRSATRRLTKAVSKRLLAVLDRLGLRKVSRGIASALQRAKFA